MSANLNRLKLYVKYSTKCATVTKIEDTQVAKLRSNGHAWRNISSPVPYKCDQLWQVADLQGEAKFKRFYDIVSILKPWTSAPGMVEVTLYFLFYSLPGPCDQWRTAQIAWC